MLQDIDENRAQGCVEMKIFGFTFFVCFLLTGCTTPIDSAQTIIPEPIGDMPSFPDFNFVDENNTTHNSSMYAGIPFVAYFSASWCTHCKPTLEALDDTVPVGHLLVFNKESREEYSNMTEWKESMESELNRTLNHPFMHAPDFALSLNVQSIPSMFFVNADGEITHHQEGLKNQSIIETYWNPLVSNDGQ